MEDVNLKAMLTIGKELDIKFGYSDHTLGIEVDIAAVAMGASCIEKHFTLDCNMEGPDHKASLEPKKLKEMVLLDQPFIRDSSITIEELVKKNISTLGENIQIRRFERFVLGEGLEKKNENFSDEVEKMMKK